MAVLLFYAVVILGGGMAAAAMIHGPRLILRATLGNILPPALLIVAAYLLSIAIVRLIGVRAPGLLFLLAFVFVFSTAQHFVWLFASLNSVGRAMLVAFTLAALAALATDIKHSGSLWPLALLARIARIVT